MGDIAAFPDARPDDGLLDIGVVTAKGFWQWSRTLARTAAGAAASSPFVETARGRKFDVKFSRAGPLRARRRRPQEDEPSTHQGARRRGDCARPGGRAVSTATPVPETWELTGDDARRVLRDCGRRQLLRDAFVRLRVADGFSHARSLAYATSLVFVQAIIAIVGLATRVRHRRREQRARAHVERRRSGSRRRPAHARREASASRGRVASLCRPDLRTGRHADHGRTLFGQFERGLNRIYGVETGPPERAEVRPGAAADRHGRLTCRRGVRVARARAHDRQLDRQPGVESRMGRRSAGRARSCSIDVRDGLAVPLLAAPPPARRLVVAVRRGRGRIPVARRDRRARRLLLAQQVVRPDLRTARRHRRAASSGRCSPRSRCCSAAQSPRSSRPCAPACASRRTRRRSSTPNRAQRAEPTKPCSGVHRDDCGGTAERSRG